MSSSKNLFVQAPDNKDATQDHANTIIELLTDRANQARSKFSADNALSLSKQERANLMDEMMLAGYISGRIKENKFGDYNQYINDGYQFIRTFNKSKPMDSIIKDLSPITAGLIEITRQLSPK